MVSTKEFLKEHLTPRQTQLLAAIASWQKSRCFSPTIGELAESLRLSRSTVFEHLEELRKKGFLSAQSSRARSLTLASKAYNFLSRTGNQDTVESFQSEDGIPLAGRVAAGIPIEAVENKGFLSLQNLFKSNSVIFALEVQGDSMIGDGISSGDFVICRKSSLADDGQLVIAIIDENNATLKRFYREKSAVRLQPANDRYEPVYSRNCRIDAVVIGLIKKF